MSDSEECIANMTNSKTQEKVICLNPNLRTKVIFFVKIQTNKKEIMF